VIYLTLFAITLALVFIKALQQRNVAHGNTLLVIPTSFVFAALEIPSIGIVAKAFYEGANILLLVGASGSAAAIGCVAAIRFHRHITGK